MLGSHYVKDNVECGMLSTAAVPFPQKGQMKPMLYGLLNLHAYAYC